MTKIAIVNDLHFGVKNDSQIILDHQEEFFSNVFFPILDKEKVEIIFDLGDTFDRRKYINFATLNRAKKIYFDKIEERNLDYHAIVGNHTVYYNNTNEINSIELLLNTKYEKYHLYSFAPHQLNIDDVKFSLVPWITNTNESICLKHLNETDSQFILGHFEIQGFEMDKGSLCEHGMEKNVFSRFEGVYSGHFHHPSEYDNIRYLGAQYEMRWSDYDGRRGFHIFDTTDKTLTFYENPYRIYKKIIYDDYDLSIEDINEIDFSPMKNTYVKVIVKNRNNMFMYDYFIDKLNESSPADVKSIEDSSIIEGEDSETLDETKTTKEILYDYVDNNVETNIQKHKIKNILDVIYIEAESMSSN